MPTDLLPTAPVTNDDLARDRYEMDQAEAFADTHFGKWRPLNDVDRGDPELLRELGYE